MHDGAPPSSRVLFVGRYRIPPGALEAWRTASAELAAFVQASLPDVLMFDAYLDPDGAHGTSVHLHRDAASFARYLAEAAPRIGGGMRLVQVVRIDLYGSPADETVARLRAMGGWPVEVHPRVVEARRAIARSDD